MAVVAKSVNKLAGVDATIAIPVGKKIYGFGRTFGFEVHLVQNGESNRLYDSTLAQVMLPVAIEFAPSSSIVFRGSAAGTPCVYMDE